jgi:4'-phosphopantetheinyl transferase
LRRRWGPELERSAAVDIWSADLTCAPDASTLAALLDDDDRAALRHCRPEASTPRAATRAAARLVLARYTGSSPRSLQFATDALGKRRLRDQRLRHRLHFSVSRSDARCVVAVTRVAAVGVDVETRVIGLPGAEGLIRRFAPEETVDLLAVGACDRVDAILRCWTRKEAYLKATGTGLAVALEHCAVSTGDHARVVRAVEGDPDAWLLRDLELDEAHIGALALRCGARPVEIRQRVLEW